MRKKFWKKCSGLVIALMVAGIVWIVPNATADKPFEGQSIVVTCWTSGFAEKLEPVIKSFEERTGAKVQILPAWGG